MNRFVFFCCIGLVSVVTSVFGADDALTRREGKYLDLITDLESTDEVNAIVATFDQAVEQWIAFWGDDSFDRSNFRVQACVMRNVSLFRQQELIPTEVPDFPFGYALNRRIWVKAQPSEYYTRHLVLHEGVHAYMYTAFDGAGPTWFQEGTADLLALHQGVGSSVKTNKIPLNREQVPYWGRFKRMGQLKRAAEVPTLETVMGYQPDLIGDVGTYGWSWAFVELLQGYPDYRPLLLSLSGKASMTGPEFNREVQRSYSDQWPILSARWSLLCHDLDYGFDWSRETVELSMSDPLWDGRPVQTSVGADQGWQSVGVRVPGGIKIRLRPEGRVTLAETTRPWISEPAGVTLQYHRDRPLGQLLVCVLPNAMQDSGEYLQPLKIHALDQEKEFKIDQYSWLLFRVNDAVGSLSDNVGDYSVSLKVGS